METTPAWKFWIFFAIALLVAFVLVPELGGRLISEQHVISSQLLLNESPETVWRAISDFAAIPSWYANVAGEERLADHDGHQVWREKYRNGEVVELETVESCPPYRMVRTVSDGKRLRERWEYELLPAENGTELRITEAGDIPSPFMRFVSRFLMGHFGAMNNYQRALALRFGEVSKITNLTRTKEGKGDAFVGIGIAQPCKVLAASTPH